MGIYRKEAKLFHAWSVKMNSGLSPTCEKLMVQGRGWSMDKESSCLFGSSTGWQFRWELCVQCQEVGICLLSVVAILPTPGVWGIHGLLLTLSLGSVLHASEGGLVTTYEVRRVMNLRHHVLCGIGN